MTAPRCQNGIHRDGLCPTCRKPVLRHDIAAVELEYTTQRQTPAGVWENVGTTGNYTHVCGEYRDWVRDLGSPEELRIVSRWRQVWPTAGLLDGAA